MAMPHFFEALSPQRLEKKELNILEAKEVVALEKIHGSQFRLMISFDEDGRAQWTWGSHHQIIGQPWPHSPHGWYAEAFMREDWRTVSLENYVKFLTDGIPGSAVMFYGELYGVSGAGTIQSIGAKYAKDCHWAIFDVAVQHPGKEVQLMDWDAMTKLCERVGLETVPIYYKGAPDLKLFNQLLEQNSIVAEQNGMPELKPIEGIVIKENPQRKINGLDHTQCYNVAKLKHEAFAETRKAKETNESLTAARAFAETVVTPERIRHVMDQVREQGVTLKEELSDLKFLCPALYLDVTKEEPELYQSALSESVTDHDINKALNYILRRTYLQMLATERRELESVKP